MQNGLRKNILALQFRADLENKFANFEKVESMLENFYAKNPQSVIDLLFLPEVWQTGWYCDDFSASAEDENGPTIEFLSNLARKHGINIVGGSYIRKTDDGFKNSCPIINKGGELKAHYDKIHLFSLDGETKTVKRGKEPLMVEFDGLKIGLSICYDIRFPELFRSYMDKNENGVNAPDLLVNLSAWPKTRTHHYQILCAARAIENQAYFLGLSQTGEIKDNVCNSGNSLFVGPFGDTIEKLDENEGYIFQTVDSKIVKEIREKFPNLRERRWVGYCPENIKI